MLELEILKMKLGIMEDLAKDPKTSIKSFPVPRIPEDAGCETGRLPSKHREDWGDYSL